MRQLIASNTVNERRLPHSRHAGLQPCMFGCSVGYILLMLSSLAIYFNFITTFIGGKWGLDPQTANICKKLADLSPCPTTTAVRWSLAVLSICHSLVWHWPCAASAAGCGGRRGRLVVWILVRVPWRRCLLLSDAHRLLTASRQTYRPTPGTRNRYPDLYRISKFDIRINEKIDNITNKKAVLSQRWPRDARYISRS